MIKQKSIDYSLFFISFILYAYLGFVVKRYETTMLFVSYFSVFAIYLCVVLKTDENNIPFWIAGAVLFRMLLVFSVPNLSDDFYRFIWDGRLLTSGYHPFAEIPSYYITNKIPVEGIDAGLFRKLNSPDYFTVYPPAAQFIFWCSAKLSPQSIYGNLVVMKSFVLAAEIGSVFIIKRLLKSLNLSGSRVLLYALNPLVILELTGNIHPEAILIFFLLLSLLLLRNQKLLLSAVGFGFAVCVKLIPLIFLPALLPVLGWKRSMLFYSFVGITCLILFLPFWDLHIIKGLQNSLGYYFSKFEFNASIYYLIRAWGYWYYDYNIIGTVGWKLALACFVVIMIISTRRLWSGGWRNIETSFNGEFYQTLMFVALTYFLFTTTLHPWYITTLLALSIFTSFRFSLAWTAMIFLTYAGYSENSFEENLWLTALEYVSVLGYLAYELWKRKDLAFQPS